MWNIFKKSNSGKKAKEEQRRIAMTSVSEALSRLRKQEETDQRERTAKTIPAGWARSETPLRAGQWARDNQYWWASDNPSSKPRPYSNEPMLKSQEWPKIVQPLPSWVEQFPGYKATAWELSAGILARTQVTLVTYELIKTSLEGYQPSFAKMMFTVKDVPFKQMESMCKELSKYNKEELELHGMYVAKDYTINDDGKIRDKTNGFLPDANCVEHVMEDLFMLYKDWEKFPNVSDHSVVAKLSFAWSKVEAMQREERDKKIHNKIHDLRENIKSCQQNIAKLEQEENKLYEDAADALNTLEAHGIGMKEIEDFRNAEYELKGEINLEMLNKLAQGMGLSSTSNYSLAP